MKQFYIILNQTNILDIKLYEPCPELGQYDGGCYLDWAKKVITEMNVDDLIDLFNLTHVLFNDDLIEVTGDFIIKSEHTVYNGDEEIDHYPEFFNIKWKFSEKVNDYNEVFE